MTIDQRGVAMTRIGGLAAAHRHALKSPTPLPRLLLSYPTPQAEANYIIEPRIPSLSLAL